MFKLKIDTKNSAFENPSCLEVCRILEETIKLLKSGRIDHPLYDFNGNVVGYFKLTNR